MRYARISETDDHGMILRFTVEAIHPSDANIDEEHMDRVFLGLRNSLDAATSAYRETMK